MSDDSYASYEGADGQPEYFDYDHPRDYEEWCAWNDVDEDEGYYAPFPPNVEGGVLFSEVVVVNSVGYEPSKEGPDIDNYDDCRPETPFLGLVDSLSTPDVDNVTEAGPVEPLPELPHSSDPPVPVHVIVRGSDPPVPEVRLLFELPDLST